MVISKDRKENKMLMSALIVISIVILMGCYKFIQEAIKENNDPNKESLKVFPMM